MSRILNVAAKNAKGTKQSSEKTPTVGAYLAIYDFADGNGAESWVGRIKAERARKWFESNQQDLGSF